MTGVVGMMSNNKEKLLKLIVDLPEIKVGQAIEYLKFLKESSEQELYMSKKEENEIWQRIETEERMKSEDVKRVLEELNG
jgi:hypothetical protein